MPDKIEEAESRLLLDKEIMALAGYIMNERSEADILSTHPLNNNIFIQSEPVSKQLKEELDQLDKKFSSGLQEYKNIKPNASLETLKLKLDDLKSIYSQYKGKIAEIGNRRNLLLESSDLASLSDARKVLFDAIDKKLKVFDQMEADIKNNAEALKKEEVTSQFAEEIKSIINILKNKDLQLNSAKIDPLITALERRLLYLITDPKDFIEIFGRFKLITPTVSTSPFSSLLKDGWPNPQDESKKDPKVRQNIIKTCYIEANNVAKITDNVTDKLKSSIEDHKSATTILDTKKKIEADLRISDTTRDMLSALTEPKAQVTAQPHESRQIQSPGSLKGFDFSSLEKQLMKYKQEITKSEELGVMGYVNKSIIYSKINKIEGYLQELNTLKTEISLLEKEINTNNPDKIKMNNIIEKQNRIQEIVVSCNEIMSTNSIDIKKLQDIYSDKTIAAINNLDKQVADIKLEISRAGYIPGEYLLPSSKTYLDTTKTIDTAKVEELKKELIGAPLSDYESKIAELHKNLIIEKNNIIYDMCDVIKKEIEQKIDSIEESGAKLLEALKSIYPNNFESLIINFQSSLEDAIKNNIITKPDITNSNTIKDWLNEMKSNLLKIDDIYKKLMSVSNTLTSLYNDPVHKNSLTLLSDLHRELSTSIKTRNGDAALNEFLKDPTLFFKKPENNKDLKTKALFEIYKSVENVNQILYARMEGGKKPQMVGTNTKMEEKINEWETEESDKKTPTEALEDYPRMMDNALTRVLAEQKRNLTTGFTLRTSSTEKRVMETVNIVKKACKEALDAPPIPKSNSDSLDGWDLIDEPKSQSTEENDKTTSEDYQNPKPF